MSKQIITIILFSIGCLQSHGQQHGWKLVYTVDTSGKDYMVPYVEYVLRRMQKFNSSDSVFKSVANMKAFSKGKNLQAYLYDILDKAEVTNKHDVIDLNSEYGKLVKPMLDSSNKLLVIKVNTLTDLLEYQFTLYDVNSTVITYNKSSSIFIAPREGNYLGKIEYALKILFPEANFPPSVKPSINTDYSCNRYLFANTDTVILMSEAADRDSPEENWAYYWSRDSTSQPIEFERNLKIQKLYGLKNGKYLINQWVSDGISYSSTVKTEFYVVSKPKVILRSINIYGKNTLNLIYASSMFGSTTLETFKKPDLFIKECPLLCKGSIVYFPIKLFDENRKIAYSGEIQIQSELLRDTMIAIAGAKDPVTYINKKSFLLPTLFEFRFLKNVKYSAVFNFRDGNLVSHSDSLKLLVFRRSKISFIEDFVIQPFKTNRYLGSGLNLAFGCNVRMDRLYSVTALIGTNLFNNIGQSHYMGLDLNLHPPSKVFMSYSGIAYKNNADREYFYAIGIKGGSILQSGAFADLKLGFGVFYKLQNHAPTSDLLFHITYSGSFFGKYSR